jgi:glutathione S-transferase
LWLLEELNVDYNLVLHTRNAPTHQTAPFRSPPSLLATGTYGKAPLLITSPSEGSRYLPESAAIATYLIRTYDADDSFGLRNGDWVRDEMLLSMILTSLGRANGFMIYLDFGAIQLSQGSVVNGVGLLNVLADLERELKEGPKGGWFMGETPGRVDILLEFYMSMIKHRGWADLEKDFPELDNWLKRVYDRPAWKRALGKAFDGVYDLNVFPKVPGR